ncbi:MAG: glucose-1-phosphate adenylyltransferase [Candidatus Riflebacteria bacterium]|nr:glucose-1-phosphate adenylyltransferase [Candidatus Riflebacteria bacterium]
MTGYASESTVAIILGGGKGTRLYPLTEHRSKPAVPLGGKYRLIDIPISNCINSMIRRIYVLTQYNSASLNRHINQGYKFDTYSRGFVAVLAAELTDSSSEWYQGTADAVRRQIRHICRWNPRHYLVLSGDQLYRMDYRELLAHHISCGAHITVSGKVVGREWTGSLGLFTVDDEDRICLMAEKPKDPEVLARLRIDPELALRLGVDPVHELYLGSMGIYVFDAPVLEELLSDPDPEDFGRHLLPKALKTHRMSVYIHQGYWEDIGTIKKFYQANLQMTQKYPPFDFYSPYAPIYTNARFLPASKFYESRIVSSLVAEGCIIGNALVENSVIGVGSIVDRSVHISDTVMMGADEYDDPAQIPAMIARGLPPRGVGSGSVVQRAIIDKNARIGRNVAIVNRDNIARADGTG